jgi:hypothetical protein
MREKNVCFPQALLLLLLVGLDTHIQGAGMQIICATPRAAAQVLTILLHAELPPVRDYQIRPVLSTIPPISYTMISALTDAQLAQIGAIPDTTIDGVAA